MIDRRDAELAGGAVAGLLAGALFAAAMQERDLSVAVTGIAGFDSSGLELVAHLLLAGLGGVAFAAIFRFQPESYATTIASGVVFGLLLWVAGTLTLRPLLEGDRPTWSAAAASAGFPSLVGHLMYGAITGLGLHVGLSALAGRPTDRFLDLRALAAGGDVPIGGVYPESPHQRLGPGRMSRLRAALHSRVEMAEPRVELAEPPKEARPQLFWRYHLIAPGLPDEHLLAEHCEGKSFEFVGIGAVPLKGFDEPKGLFEASTGIPANRGLGVSVASDDQFAHLRSFGERPSPGAFGHSGAGGQVAWADPETGISFVYCTNGFVDALKSAQRSRELSTLASACGR